MKHFLPILLIAALSACVSAAEDTPKLTPLAKLQTAWRDDLSKRDAFKAYHGVLNEQIFETKRIGIREITGQAAFERVDSTLTPAERHTLILLGELEPLRKQPKLLEVYNPGTLGSGFTAYMSAEGNLLFFWIIPEG
jgi:hypothetical protein